MLKRVELTDYSEKDRKRLEADLDRVFTSNVFYHGLEVSDETSGHVADMIWDLPRKELPYYSNYDDEPYASHQFLGWIMGTDRFVEMWDGSILCGDISPRTVVVFAWNAETNRMSVEDFWQYDRMQYSEVMNDMFRRCPNLIDLFPPGPLPQ